MKVLLIFLGAGLLAIGAVVGLLTFAHSYAELADQTRRCATSLAVSQWPKWIGCTMAAHENLAGGLIGGAAALLAAGVAYVAVRLQLTEERAQRKQRQAEAKLAATVAISQIVHAAATAMSVFRQMIRPDVQHTQQEIRTVEVAIGHVRSALEGSMIRDVILDLEVNDRLLVIVILERLRTFTNIADSFSPVLGREGKYRANIETLMGIRFPLRAFDEQLADVFDRDGSVPPNTPLDNRT